MINEINFIVLDYTLKGGIERYVANMCDIMSNMRISINIYSLHKTNEQPFYHTPDNTNILYTSDIKFGRFYKLTTLFALLKLKKIFENKKENAIIISTSPIVVIILFFINRKILRRTIASEHSTYNSHGIIIRALRIISYKKVSTVVTQTRDGVNNFLNNKIKCEKIPNPVTIFKDNNQWMDNIKNKTYAEFNCLSVARFEDVKQLDHFVKAALFVNEKYPQITFNLVGSGKLQVYLEELIEEMRISNAFKIISSTPKVNEFYKKADLYIITSASEAFPMTAIEALSFGVPVISYDKLIGPKEIIENEINGYLVEQNNYIALANKIIEIYLNNELHNNLRKKALLSAKEYSPNEILTKWMKII